MFGPGSNVVVDGFWVGMTDVFEGRLAKSELKFSIGGMSVLFKPVPPNVWVF